MKCPCYWGKGHPKLCPMNYLGWRTFRTKKYEELDIYFGRYISITIHRERKK